MDRLTSLAVFVRVVESSGFSAAARRLNMSTTMVSSHVQALEDRLGARLLNRTTRKVSVTDVGRAYYERCTQILADIEDADRLAGALQSTPRGTLRLYSGTHIVRFIAPVVAEFLATHPGASVDLTMGERMIGLVEEGFDLAIMATPPADSSLIIRHLLDWRPVLCCAPSYLTVRPAPEHPRDLVGHNCLRYALFPFGDEWRFLGADGTPALVRISGNLVTNSGEALRAAAVSGVGIFLAPGFIAAEDFAAGRLVPLLPGYRPVGFALNAIYPHRHLLSAKVRVFLELLIRHLAADRLRSDPLAAAPPAPPTRRRTS